MGPPSLGWMKVFCCGGGQRETEKGGRGKEREKEERGKEGQEMEREKRGRGEGKEKWRQTFSGFREEIQIRGLSKSSHVVKSSVSFHF